MGEGRGQVVAGVGELVGGVGADGFQHAVAGLVATGGLHQGLLDQGAEDIQDVVGREGLVGADRFQRFDCRAAGEQGESAGQDGLGVFEQIPAPFDQGQQGALAGQCGATARGEEAEAIVEAAGDLVDAHGPQFGGGELECEWDAVELAADRHDGCGGVLVEREARADRGGPVEEQLHRRRALRHSRFRRLRREIQRSEMAQHLADDRQRFPAGGQDSQLRQSVQQMFGELGRSADQMFAIVQNQYRRTDIQQFHQPCGSARGQPLGGIAERSGDRIGELVGGADLGERHEKYWATLISGHDFQ